MELPLTNKEFDYVVTQLWKCRGSEESCKKLYEKLLLVQTVMKDHDDYKRVLREKHNMVI